MKRAREQSSSKSVNIFSNLKSLFYFQQTNRKQIVIVKVNISKIYKLCVPSVKAEAGEFLLELACRDTVYTSVLLR